MVIYGKKNVTGGETRMMTEPDFRVIINQFMETAQKSYAFLAPITGESMEGSYLNTLKRRILTLLLSMAMIFSVMQTGLTAFAADDTDLPEDMQLTAEVPAAEEETSEETEPAEAAAAEALSPAEASVPAEGERSPETEQETVEAGAEPVTAKEAAEAEAEPVLIGEAEAEKTEAEAEPATAGEAAEAEAEPMIIEEAAEAGEPVGGDAWAAAEEPAEEPVEEPGATKELVSSSDRYEVTVSYDATAEIPEGARLVLTEFDDGDEEFIAARDALVADENGSSAFSQTAEEERKGLGMAAFDLTIYDADGNVVEPKAEVRVSFRFKEFPEGVDAETLAGSMEIQHLNETPDGVVVEKIATYDSEEAGEDASIGEVRVNEQDETVEAETVVDGFSTYTVTWGNGAQAREVVLHFVDAEGNDLGDGFTYNGQSVDNGTANLAELIPANGMFDLSQFKKEGYSLSNTHIGQIGDMDGTTPTIIRNEVERADNALRYWTFNTGNDTAGVTRHDFPAGRTDLYLVYDSTAMAGQGGGSSGGGEEPDLADLGHNKEAKSNNDGTYKLSLSVKGSAQNEETDPHVNVIVVFDTSSSMVSNSIPDDNTMTRLEAAKDQVNALAAELLGNNTAEHPDAVEMALVTFNRNAAIESMGGSYWTKSASTFTSVVGTYTDGPITNNGQGTAGAGNTGINTAKGTNWAQGLQKAIDLMQDAGTDDDPTYVLFITDGAPSQYWPSGQATGTYAEGEGCYLGARDEARSLVGGEGAILYALFTYGSATDYNKDYLGKLVDYAYNDDSAKSDYRFNVADNESFKNKLKAILGIISMNFAYANVSLDDGVTGLSTVVFERIDTDSFAYTITYRNYTSATQYTEETITPTVNADGSVTIPSRTYSVPDAEASGGLRTITTKEVTVTGAEYSETSKAVTWDLKKVTSGSESDLYLLEEGWTYTVSFDIWPGQVSYDLVAALNNGILEYGDPYRYTDENGNVVTVPFSEYKTQVTDTRPYTLLTNTHFTITYQQVTEIVNPDGTTSYELGPEKPIDHPYVYGMKLVSQEMPVKKEFSHAINAQDPYTKVRFYLLMDGGFYQTDGTLSDTLVPYTGDDEAVHTIFMDLDDSNSWTGSLYIAPGVIKDERESGGQMLVLETGHEYSLYEEVLAGPVYEYEFTPQTVRPMVINGDLTYLIKQDKYNVPKDSDTIYEIDGDTYFPAPEDAQLLVGTNRKTAELDITKIVDDPQGLLTDEQEAKETFTYRVTLMIPDGTDPAGIVGYEYVPRTQDNAFLLYGYQKTDEGQGFPEDVDRFSGETYRAWNTLVYRDLVEWETVDGKVKAKTDEDGNILWLIPAVDGYHTVTYDMTLKQDEVIRFTNLPSGTKYTIQEIYANKYPADNTGGITSGRPPVEDPSNIGQQGYQITRIQSTGVNEETAQISEAGDTVTGTIENLDTRYYNQFTNTIGDNVEAELKVTKHLDGYEWSGERYYFDLSADPESEEAPLPGGNGGRTALYTKAASGTDDVTQSFGRVRFTAEGEYTYIIRERTPTDPDDENVQESDRLPDIIYDETEKKVTVTVKVGDEGFYIESITGEDGTDYLTADLSTQPASAEVTVTNARERGDLEVTKTVVSSTAADRTKGFSFRVTLSDTAISGTYGDMTFTGGVAEFTLADGETAAAEGIPTGVTYTVEEEAADGFTTQKTGDTGEITTEKSTAAFTNTRKEGNLAVTKTVESPVASDRAVDTTYEITVTLDDKTISGTYGGMTFTDGVATFELADGESISAIGLPEGTAYTVEEKAYDLFDVTYIGQTGTIPKDDTADAAVENTRKLGDLEVTKTVVSSTAADKTKEFSFRVTLSDTAVSGTYGDMTFTDGVAEFTLADGGTRSATGLPAGITYTVEEEKADGFTVSYTGKEGTISAEKSTAAVTNSSTQYSVEKIWDDSDDRDGVRPQTVTMQLYRAAGSGAPAEVEGATAVLPMEDGSLTYTWTSLETADENGDPYVYSVREVGETDGKIADSSGGMTYSVSYDTSEEGKTKVTNRHPVGPEKTVYSDIGCTVRIDGQPVQAGQTLVYRIWYRNMTGQTAEKVTITDTIPGPTTYAEGSAVSTVNGADGPRGVLSGDTLTWTFTDVPAGAEIEAVFQVTVSEMNKDYEIRNKGIVEEGGNRTETNEVVNSKPVKDVFEPADPTVSIDGKTVTPGQELVYAITYKNDSGETAKVTITDRIPAHTSYVDGSATENGTYENGTVTWTFGEVPAGKVITVKFAVIVDNDCFGTAIGNTATVQEGENSRNTNETVCGTPVIHDPPVLKKITGDDPGRTDTFRFRLTAVSTDADAEMPMPEGSSGKTCTVEAEAGAEKEFGTLVFTEPGSYWYTIEEVNTGLEGYRYDTAVYKLHYLVEKEPDGRLAMTLETTKDGTKVSESYFTFTNEYRENPPPDTGDTNNLSLWIALMAVSAAAVAVLIWTKKRRGKR